MGILFCLSIKCGHVMRTQPSNDQTLRDDAWVMHHDPQNIDKANVVGHIRKQNGAFDTIFLKHNYQDEILFVNWFQQIKIKINQYDL